MGLTLLSQASLSLDFDTFSIAVYLTNRLPSIDLQGISPMEKLFTMKPDYSILKIFGCLCFPSLRSYNNHKIDPKSTPCLFLGYSNQHKGYKSLASSGRLYISRHVLFDEQNFPSSKHFQLSNPPATSSQILTSLPRYKTTPYTSSIPITS